MNLHQEMGSQVCVSCDGIVHHGVCDVCTYDGVVCHCVCVCVCV